MKKITLGEIIRDLNVLDDDWTICARWPWTSKSEACVARTKADLDGAAARDLECLVDVGLARDLLDGVDPEAWVNHVIHHAERAFSDAA